LPSARVGSSVHVPQGFGAKPKMADEDEGRLFGRLYTYKELMNVEKPQKERPKPGERPAHWPSDTEPDTAKWAFWLPEGWGQGIKPTSGGKTLKCYISPTGKRLFHKKDIEKELGRMLPTKEPPAPKDDGEAPPVKSLDEAIPLWPEKDDWLPKDWRVGYRRLPSRLHRIYVPPNQEEGFFYHRAEAEKFIAGEPVNLSPFGSSRKMASISADAAAGGRTPQTSRKEKKRKLGATSRLATAEDYRQSSLQVVQLPASDDSEATAARLSKAGAPDAKQIADDSVKLRSLLLKRGFNKETELLGVVSGEPDGGALCWIGGIYYQLADTFQGRPCYQGLQLVSSKPGVACTGVYVFWSTAMSRWKLGALDDSKAGLAYCEEDRLRPVDLQQPWRMLRGDFPGLLAKKGPETTADTAAN